ncbi:MAG: FmdB family zinc ribbon protein [Thermoleophilia bacterium]
MARIDLVCRSCQHTFSVLTRGPIRDKQKRCPECSSTDIRQTLSSYLENGPLSSPLCGAERQSTGFG